jgi:hypothetical protein
VKRFFGLYRGIRSRTNPSGRHLLVVVSFR